MEERPDRLETIPDDRHTRMSSVLFGFHVVSRVLVISVDTLSIVLPATSFEVRVRFFSHATLHLFRNTVTGSVLETVPRLRLTQMSNCTTPFRFILFITEFVNVMPNLRILDMRMV